MNGVKVHAGPGKKHKAIARLPFHEWISPLAKPQKGWLKVRTTEGITGYVRPSQVTGKWLRVYKQERKIALLDCGKVLKEYDIVLSYRNPFGDKKLKGDHATPEGEFYICELVRIPHKKFGARFMRLSYPNSEDAKRGLDKELITQGQHDAIVKAVKRGSIPDQRTPLGGGIVIHGGKRKRYYTYGCVALKDKDLIELYELVPLGTRVVIKKYDPTKPKKRLPSGGSRFPFMSEVSNIGAPQARGSNPAP